ncbi:non-homologous end-joining DNA ligase [Nocardia sp. CNY236]|uniref:non-homologous end-joining DNA ligase n=1 Tax=Nocardia sp. CNY236 TaxID=1169152 RepID=UPI00040462F8|nr:non-homologous end-joining DNA ligase [Nocardia sp. CNY236]
MSAPVEIEVDGTTTMTISNPDKVYFAERGETKLDLVRYYQTIAQPLLNVVGGRPLLLERHPDGATGKSWFQKRIPKSAPGWLRTVEVRTPNGTTSAALVAHDLAHILWAVNQGCLGFHVWPNRADDLDITDELRIDLDPSPGTTFTDVARTAVRTRDLCAELGIESHIKTSGSRGLHLYATLAPRWDGYQVRAAAVALARELERRYPNDITAQWWKEQRGSRVFVDFNQNAPHKTVFGAWCVRPTPSARVSTPITWSDLDSIVPEELTIATVPTRYAAFGDPWAGRTPQSITPLLEMSQQDLAAGLMDAPWPPQYPKMPGEPKRVQPSRDTDQTRRAATRTRRGVQP